MKLLAPALLLLSSATPPPSVVPPAPALGASPVTAPRIAEMRVYRIRQTVALADVPAGAKDVRLWVPIPTDGPWQHVLDRSVVEAPAGWKVEKQPLSGGEMIVARAKGPGPFKVVTETTIVRQSPAFDFSAAEGQLQPNLFTQELRQDAQLMSVDAKIVEMARKAVGDETNVARKVVLLLDAVGDAADHYSKDATKPKCGRGSAQDCLEVGGGCCTDLHSLFIAAARASGIPARIEFGYRLNAAKENTDYDPSYRCWVEYFVPGAGWVPTDIVVADAGERAARKEHYGKLDARRVWLWEGRDLDLVPKQGGAPIQTMLCGWAEIDGVAVDVLPAADGAPSKLSRTIHFQDLTPKDAATAK